MSIALSLRKRAWRLRRGPVSAERLGASWALYPADWIDNRLLAAAPYEEEQLARCRGVIARNGIDLFLDIGANIGVYTVLLSLNPGVQEVHAFEPVARTAERLRRHVGMNGLEDRVEVHQLGLSRESGIRTIHLDPNSSGLARLEPATANRPTSMFKMREEIRLAALDGVLCHRGRRALLKIDVEGAGIDVLSGAAAFLRGNCCAVQIETEPKTEAAVAEAFSKLDYWMDGRIGADLYFLHPELVPAEHS